MQYILCYYYYLDTVTLLLVALPMHSMVSVRWGFVVLISALLSGGGTAMLSSIRLRDDLGMNVCKQMKAAAFGTAGALMRSRQHRLEESEGIDLSIPLSAESCDTDASTAAVVAAAAGTVVAWAIEISPYRIPHYRRPNVHRDRPYALEFIRNWSDSMFVRQLRLHRSDFFDILQLIYDDICPNKEMATRSSGSCVDPELQLAMTCRCLAGAQYLDFIWWNVDVNGAWIYIDQTLKAINKRVDNIKLPFTEAEVRKSAAEFSAIQYRKYSQVVTPGTAGATDGLVIERTQPPQSDLDGKDYRIYLNRKGFFAWVALAVVNAFCVFLMFEVKWPGATNDCTAMEQSEAMKWLAFLAQIGFGYLAGDDAFSGIHELLLTPFTKSQLKRMKQVDFDLYLRMRTFNNVLSSQRITVERAFGMLVRRWGCFWSAFERRERQALLMIMVCVKLHNICILRWMTNNPDKIPSDSDLDLPEYNVDEDDITEEEMLQRLENKYVGAPRRAKQNLVRLQLVQSIHDAGIRFTHDDDFLTTA